MKTFGKNSRGGKRSSSSYSSWCSTAATLIFVFLCGFAVYTLTSSSSSSLLSFSQSSPTADHRPPLDESEVGSGDSEQDSSQNPNGEKQEDEKQGSGLERSHESREQKQLEKQMEEERENENRPRLQMEDGEGLAETLTGEQSEIKDFDWDLCNVSAGPDYIPCLDNVKAIRKLKSFKHYEHRERHCPEESPTCLAPLPKGYKRCIGWPGSRDKIWYSNVPRTKLAEVKGHQNWVRVDGEYLTFPGGGTQFIHGALHCIDFIGQVRK